MSGNWLRGRGELASAVSFTVVSTCPVLSWNRSQAAPRDLAISTRTCASSSPAFHQS
jgi:hypothetical protein